MRYIATIILALCVGACGEDTGLVEVGAVCEAIVDGTVSADGAERSTVWVSSGCTGVLIAPTVVLTAAHCGNPAYITTRNGTVRSNINYVPHPDYVGTTNDLALLFLDGTIPDMSPVVIGWPMYGEALVQGYGVDENGELGGLREGITHVTDFYSNHKIGTGPDGTDTCFGDSGGPMYQRGLLVGITSSGYAGMTECGEGGLYVIPALYQEWITSEVAEVRFTGKCSG